MQWMCRSSTSTPPPGPQLGTRNGHEHQEHETQEPFVASPPPLRTSVRTGVSSRMILGTSITCSGTGHSVSKKRRTSTSWSPLQRHRDVKNRQRRRGVDKLVHEVLLNPLLRPDASEAVGPRPGGRHLIHVQRKVLSACHLGGGMFRNLAV